MDKIDISFIMDAIPKILEGLPITLTIMLSSLAVSIVVAAFLVWCQTKKQPVVDGIIKGYVSIVRGTPFIIQLFLVYYAIPSLLMKLGIDLSQVSKMVFVIVAFVINVSAYLSEIAKTALSSVDGNEIEAAYAIGMSKRQVFFTITLPSACKLALPNMCNVVIVMTKETSVAFQIGLIDMMGKAKIIAGYSYRFFETYAAIALVYWGLTIIIQILFWGLQYRMNREGRKRWS